jgi:hypothetical protein
MEIAERHNNWILYRDSDGHYLNSRCSWGAVEPTAKFKLLESEVQEYIGNGNKIIHELSKQADSPMDKERYENDRPIPREKLIAMRNCHK